MIIPAVFYVVILCAGLDLDFLRRERWLFHIASSEETWYKFYTYFGGFPITPWSVALSDRGLDLTKTRWGSLWATLPTQLALLFFNILHPPLNVPALGAYLCACLLAIVLTMLLTAVSLDSDVDTNKELIAHGYSNFLAGIAGTVPNYLVYVNTLLYV